MGIKKTPMDMKCYNCWPETCLVPGHQHENEVQYPKQREWEMEKERSSTRKEKINLDVQTKSWNEYGNKKNTATNNKLKKKTFLNQCATVCVFFL